VVAFACWKVACRFPPIKTNVERKMLRGTQ
jgi:hypothetical protein